MHRLSNASINLRHLQDFHIHVCTEPAVAIRANVVIKKQATSNVLGNKVFAIEGRFVVRPGAVDTNLLSHSAYFH